MIRRSSTPISASFARSSGDSTVNSVSPAVTSASERTLSDTRPANGDAALQRASGASSSRPISGTLVRILRFSGRTVLSPIARAADALTSTLAP